MSTTVQSATWWIDRFFWPVPAQPNTKKLYPGYGYYLKQVRRADDVSSWFGGRKAVNLAVTSFGGGMILDFDDYDLYQKWAHFHPAEAKTYTEFTPNDGVHLFFYKKPFTEIPAQMLLKKGVEIKNTVLVFPSKVDGKCYQCGSGEILEADAVNLFVGLTVPGAPTPHLLKTIQTTTARPGTQITTQIKNELPVLTVLQELQPDFQARGAGRWLTGLCPFHDDKNPSFWIDTKRGLFGCHGCGARGDVINLFAKLKGLTVVQAIEELRGRVPQ